MQVEIGVLGDDAGDSLRSLRTWLAAEDELRGRVRLVEAAPPPGTLGTLPEVLLVAAAHGGLGTLLAGVVITWLRLRRGDLTIKVTLDGSSVEITAKSVRGLDTDGVREQADRLAELLARTGDRPDGGEPRDPPGRP